MRTVRFACVVSGVLPVANSRPAATWAMSSLGSSRSFGGTGAVSAAGRFTRPYPVRSSKPGELMSRADSRSISATCPASSSGWTVHSQAAAAATIGEEKLVPATAFQIVGSVGWGTAIDSPGAARSTAAFPVENDEGWSVFPVAAAVRTCGYAPG